MCYTIRLIILSENHLSIERLYQTLFIKTTIMTITDPFHNLILDEEELQIEADIAA